MKRLLISLSILVLFAGFMMVSVSAAADNPQQQQHDFNLVSISPASPYPGQKVTVKVSYSEAFAKINAGKAVTYVVSGSRVVNDKPSEEVETRCAGDCTFAISNDKESEFSFFAPVQDGTYTLFANLSLDPNQKQQEAPLALGSVLVASALPASVAQLFAGLGLFAAVMVIMALGTEVVIEFGKFCLGMKSKVSAMQAFQDLQKELPGQLTQLGVDDKAIKSLNPIFDGMEKTLQPLQELSQVEQNFSSGMFQEAYQGFKKLASLHPENIDPNQLAELKGQIKRGIERGLLLLSQKVPLQPAVIQKIQKDISDMVDAIQVNTNVDDLLNQVFGILQNVICDHEPEWTKQWLLNHADNLVNDGGNYVAKLAEENLFAPLVSAGIDPSCIEILRASLKNNINVAGNFLRKDVDIYTEAVKKLLIAVEEQRNNLQSPARRLWRRLRKVKRPIWQAAIAGGILFGLVWRIFTWELWPVKLIINAGSGVGLLWLGALIWAVLASVVLMVAAAIMVPWAKRQETIQHRLSYPLGDFLRYVVERGFNRLLGREWDVVAADKYGLKDEKVIAKINTLQPDNLAEILLEREQKHQDEEVTRVRMIRVLSLLIGTYLAYQLQIDAAAYLNYAIPGIESQINMVNLNLGHLLPGMTGHMTVGMILTGLAASAGSKFWRDLLGRLQSTRDQAEEAAKTLSSMKDTLNSLTSGGVG